ncbi:potassium transporter 1 [Cynara cardunculus var. scolymus]|uniref:potassium transporter 1 n=1 Tax=Cynara cardunculus var. scolymus TaxID=59895 RepID=UPI000D623A54|nr:potassium transporter 1 [Cynara cardunculus var. scolymus]
MFHPRPSFESLEYGLQNQKLNKASCSAVLSLAYQSLGVVYGDLSTSPLYVYKTTFSGKLSLHEDDEEIYGVLSFIFWTFTLIALLKYVFIVLSADDNGEGGSFALYSLLCRHAKLSMLPNQQETDEKLSAYGVERTAETWQSFASKSFFEKHTKFRKGLLIFVLLGTCMTIGDGVFTPAISVLSAVSGVRIKATGLHENYVVAISCVLLVGLFSIQHHGTHRVAFLFAPIVTAWLLSIAGIGIYNIIQWNPQIFHALSPIYMVKLLKRTRREGWLSLGGVVLSITGVETMFADLGHFSTLSVKIAFTFLVYPCLVLAYLGEAAFLSRHHEDIQRSFYKAIPAEAVFWPVFIVATFAAVVGSQAAISATFSIISQCCALNCFPHVKIVHTSRKIYGQVYIPEVNWMLLSLCLAVTIGLRDTNMIGHAYGLAVTTVMFVTTCLMTMVMIIVWKQQIITAAAFLVVFGSIELLYLSAAFFKVPEGGWIPLLLSLAFMSVMYVWNYGKLKKHEFDLENKVSMNRILSLGPSLGMVRVPGIGLVYTNLVMGIPAIFGHFVTNLPAFHQVLVFVCVKSVQVPYVGAEERMLVGRVGPQEFHMFRCIVRYGYKDVHHENYNFENRLVAALVEYVEKERKMKDEFGDTESDNLDDDVSPELTFTLPDHEEKMVRSFKEIEESFAGYLETHSSLKDESIQILKAREAGIAYILGHSYARAKKSSSIFAKLAIDVVYSFLSRNCRGTDVVLNVPHTSLLEVGMIYYV